MHGVQFRNRIESWAKKLGRANMPSLTEEPSRRVDISPVKVIVYTTQIGGQSGRVNIKRRQSLRETTPRDTLGEKIRNYRNIRLFPCDTFSCGLSPLRSSEM